MSFTSQKHLLTRVPELAVLFVQSDAGKRCHIIQYSQEVYLYTTIFTMLQ